MNNHVDKPTDEYLSDDSIREIDEASRRPICDPMLMEAYRTNASHPDPPRRQMSMMEAALKFVFFGLLMAVAFVIMLLCVRH